MTDTQDTLRAQIRDLTLNIIEREARTAKVARGLRAMRADLLRALRMYQR